MKNFIKKENGITLIALVITIIVLLILAGVSISMLSGENGILKQATNASETHKYAGAKEQIWMECDYITDGADIGTINLTTTEENITNLNLDEIQTIESTTNSLKVTLKNGEIIEIQGKKIPTLVYGKVYKGTINYEETDFETILCFSKKYGIAISSRYFNKVDTYSYDKETGIITINGEKVYLTENGISAPAMGGTVNLELTDEEIFTLYSPTLDTSSNLYNGIYYSEEAKSFIGIETSCDDTNYNYSLFFSDGTAEGGGTGIPSEEENFVVDYMEEQLSTTYGITMSEDRKSLTRNGYTYTLIETLE